MRTKWDSLGARSYYSCSKFSKKWNKSKLTEHTIYDTLGLYRYTYEYLDVGYKIVKQGFSRDSNKVFWITEVYDKNSVLISIDSLFEAPEETEEVYETFYYAYTEPEFAGGVHGLNKGIRNFLEDFRIKKSQKGIYSLRFEINSFGDVVQVESISSAKKGEKVTNKLEQFFLQSKWKPAGRYDNGVKSKLLVELKIK